MLIRFFVHIRAYHAPIPYAKVPRFRWLSKKVCNGFIEVCNHCTLFWRTDNYLVILHCESGNAAQKTTMI